MLHNYCQKLFDLLAEKRKIVLSSSQMWVFFSIWLAHLPFGTICSRKFNVTAASKGVGNISGYSLPGAKSALMEACFTWITKSRESSYKCWWEEKNEGKPMSWLRRLFEWLILVTLLSGAHAFTWEFFYTYFLSSSGSRLELNLQSLLLSVYFCLYCVKKLLLQLIEEPADQELTKQSIFYLLQRYSEKLCSERLTQGQEDVEALQGE